MILWKFPVSAETPKVVKLLLLPRVPCRSIKNKCQKLPKIMWKVIISWKFQVSADAPKVLKLLLLLRVPWRSIKNKCQKIKTRVWKVLISWKFQVSAEAPKVVKLLLLQWVPWRSIGNKYQTASKKCVKSSNFMNISSFSWIAQSNETARAAAGGRMAPTSPLLDWQRRNKNKNKMLYGPLGM